MNDPLVNDSFKLKKFPGKGGWTYAEIPAIAQDKKNPFGWVKVKGSIDHHAIKQYKLMPMGNGLLFLPVKKEIRKIIQKEAGNSVRLVLHLDHSKLEIPKEIMACFEMESPELLFSFKSLSEGKQKTYLDWIYAAKREQTKADRISKLMRDLSSTSH